MERILITGGRVIDPASGLDASADVAIDRGRIVGVGAGLDRTPADRVIDAGGLIVCPGLIDPHVHLREPGQTHKEDIASGTRAAIAGGFTTVCCMPNTSPAIDTPEMVLLLQHAIARTARCRVFVVGAATQGRQGERLAEIGLLAQAGAVAISDDGDAVPTAGVMNRALAACSAAGLVFMQHCQDATLTGSAPMHAGEVAQRLGVAGWMREAEEIIVERDVRLVRKHAGARYHVQHISSAGTVEIIRRARADGLHVTGEASPHHLILTHEACAAHSPDGGGWFGDPMAKMNPPLREQSDVEALRYGVADGTITILATDHAPHAGDEKGLPFEEAPFGIIGLETALSLYAEALVASGTIGWGRLIELMTAEPARLCGLDRHGLGSLAVGSAADVTIIDPERSWTVSASDLKGKSRNTPFLGRAMLGKAVGTIVGGRVMLDPEAGELADEAVLAGAV